MDFSNATSARKRLGNSLILPVVESRQVPQPGKRNIYRLLPSYRLGSSPFARRYLRNRFYFLFLGVLRCFTSPRLASLPYFIEVRIPEVCSGRFPHSGTPGSKPAYGSPRIIAVSHALLRLLVPRHPPYTLFDLIVKLDTSTLYTLFRFQGTK